MKNKIIEYKVVKAYELGLEVAVRTAIFEGWQPLGGVTNCGDWFYQAVVKYEEVEK